MYIVQDQPLPPSETLLLPPLESLYKVYTRNQELPQPGDSRPVLPPSQHTLSKQMMKKWEVWEENIAKVTNKRILEQMAFHAPQVIRATSTQDLDPLPLASNDYPSVLPHEMYALEPGDIPSRILSWKALGFLGSFTHSARRLSCPWGRDPWGTRNCFVSCPYSFPQHCMPYRLSVGAGLFTSLFWLVIKTHKREQVLAPHPSF